MSQTSILERLAVCNWSLQSSDPQAQIKDVQATGLPRIQCELDPLRDRPDSWGTLPDLCKQNGIKIVSGMFRTIGEDYSTLESIKKTGGIVPDHTWEQNWKNIQKNADIAESLNLPSVMFHAGFLPEDKNDPQYGKIYDRICKIADLFAEFGIDLLFETGQESAEHLRLFLEDLARPNIGVNFDPANMILYAKGDPIEAVQTLGTWIRQCHIKDANKTKTPGTWGDEVPVGTGEVQWKGFFDALESIGFEGNLCIEREAGSQRVQDITAARKHIESVVS